MGNNIHGGTNSTEDSRDRNIQCAFDYINEDSSIGKIENFITSSYSTIGESFYATPIKDMSDVPMTEDKLSAISSLREPVQSILDSIEMKKDSDGDGVTDNIDAMSGDDSKLKSKDSSSTGTSSDPTISNKGDADGDGIVDYLDTNKDKTLIEIFDEAKFALKGNNYNLAKIVLSALLKIFDKLSEGSTINAAVSAASAAGNMFNPMQNTGAGDVGGSADKVSAKEGSSSVS